MVLTLSSKVRLIVSQRAKHETGFTVDFFGKDANKTDGYFVSVLLGINDIATIEQFAQRLRGGLPDGLPQSQPFIGFWRDSETGIPYFDLSFWFAEKDAALEFAAREKQLAIFAIAANDCIYL